VQISRQTDKRMYNIRIAELLVRNLEVVL